MNTASQPKSQLAEWGDLIHKQGEESRAKENLRNELLDKIIIELDSCNAIWYLLYTSGNEIASSILSYNLNEEGIKAHRRYVQERKRHIVETCIIPAMHACVRAGFLKPSDEQ